MTSTKINLDRLTALGQEVLEKASQNPTAQKFIQGAVQMKEQVDDLSKRVRGLEKMEKKVEALEKRVAKLERGAPKKATSSRKKTSSSG